MSRFFDQNPHPIVEYYVSFSYFSLPQNKRFFLCIFHFHGNGVIDYRIYFSHDIQRPPFSHTILDLTNSNQDCNSPIIRLSYLFSTTFHILSNELITLVMILVKYSKFMHIFSFVIKLNFIIYLV